MSPCRWCVFFLFVSFFTPIDVADALIIISKITADMPNTLQITLLNLLKWEVITTLANSY